ncbi:NAD(+)/NADH kinase [Denitrobaculum tricleocarpae]|uniref:Sugar kinase n=1 Tax=Denitrobaculum tricleocarpae TaxID=2591009 RepID=A0A545TML6_9PROT|nr:NAD(+)/NADH kinase [Denitrobaculum tricleocarpae]TQV78469.1 hypothetical protein FKG95_18075 [Denitrobaculum tricleocarpae]
MSSLNPRVVLITRQTEYASLLAAHATRGQAAFFLQSRGQNIEEVEARDRIEAEAITGAKRSIPSDWSFAQVLRDDLNRFLFFPNDIIVAIGQDGLVANLAKYLDGQAVIGISPDPARTEGVLTPNPVDLLGELLPAVAHQEVGFQKRAMVRARLGEGDELTALNELFIGHRSHQSARYVVNYAGAEEFQSSSGMIVATGTGMTGWAKSIMTATHHSIEIGPEEPRAAFFAREPWPSRISGCEISAGEIQKDTSLRILSRINEGGVIFADGIEQDFLAFNWGVEAEIGISQKQLRMVLP